MKYMEEIDLMRDYSRINERICALRRRPFRPQLVMSVAAECGL
jgi:hypothetical protein